MRNSEEAAMVRDEEKLDECVVTVLLWCTTRIGSGRYISGTNLKGQYPFNKTRVRVLLGQYTMLTFSEIRTDRILTRKRDTWELYVPYLT